MPSFLQSSFLMGAVAIAIPVLIHLFFRLRTKRVDLGTIRFLRIVLEENARRRKVMRWFLLALRMLLVALLVGLFARPFLTAAAVQGDGELVVVLIDQSATMQWKSEQGRLIDVAVAEARTLLSGTGTRVRSEVAFFDHAVHPLDESHGDLLPALTQRSSDEFAGATNYGTAIAWARDLCVKATTGPKTLHLFTDLQRSGLDWTEVEPFPDDVKVYLHDLGPSVINNLAVTDVRTPRTWIRPGDTAVVRATVLHGGALAREEVGVTLEVGRVPSVPNGTSSTSPVSVDFAKLTDRITLREKVKLEADASLPLDFELPALAEGLWQGRVSIESNDDLAFDNLRFFAISATPAYRILVVNHGIAAGTPASETYFLEAALRLAAPEETYTDSPFAPTTITLAEAERLPKLTAYDAVILANVPQVSPENADALASFVKQGGGLLIFTGDQTTAASTVALQQVGLTAGNVSETRIAIDLPWRFQKWNERHPVYQSLSDPQHGDLRRMAFAAYTPITPVEGAEVIAEFDTGDPAVIERQFGQGIMLWITTSCGREWSDWCQTSLYLPLMHQWLGYEVGLTAGGRVRQSILDAASQDGPLNDMVATERDSQSSKRVLQKPGVWQTPAYATVVNVSQRESETERCTPEEFENRFALKFVKDTSTASVASSAELSDLRRDEIWHWIACVLLGVLLLEGFVGNRTTA